ncbi:hypothetical protein BCR34DRAFT_117119 [Clohesyomyces aquaticus]|uniref:Uncharacterized protein n=1 Tax=Clohesyomyces aquaticus TaxID=1231657 RepID=A0A1Y1YPW3_9PLEO|nr:hypothetical protein BCR34DRAFT_117119 [Clohesyomyces aquaticus]
MCVGLWWIGVGVIAEVCARVLIFVEQVWRSLGREVDRRQTEVVVEWLCMCVSGGYKVLLAAALRLPSCRLRNRQHLPAEAGTIAVADRQARSLHFTTKEELTLRHQQMGRAVRQLVQGEQAPDRQEPSSALLERRHGGRVQGKRVVAEV